MVGVNCKIGNLNAGALRRMRADYHVSATAQGRSVVIDKLVWQIGGKLERSMVRAASVNSPVFFCRKALLAVLSMAQVDLPVVLPAGLKRAAGQADNQV